MNLPEVRKSDGWTRVYRFPALVGLLQLTGLLAALLWEVWGRYFSWIALSLPVLVCVWCYFRRSRMRR